MVVSANGQSVGYRTKQMSRIGIGEQQTNLGAVFRLKTDSEPFRIGRARLSAAPVGRDK